MSCCSWPLSCNRKVFQFRELIFQVVDLFEHGGAIQTLGKFDARGPHTLQAFEGFGRLAEGMFKIMVLGLETGELVVGREGGPGGLIPHGAGVQGEQVAVEAEVFLHRLGVALDDHPGPVAFQFHHVGHGVVCRCTALALRSGKELVGFAGGGERDQLAQDGDLPREIGGKLLAGTLRVQARDMRRPRHPVLGTGARTARENRQKRYNHSDSKNP